MKKKLTALALVVVLLAVAVVGGSLAYFTDNEKATNVMTLGKIDIVQNEYNYAGDPIDTDDFGMLLPMGNSPAWKDKVVEFKDTTSFKVFNSENVMEKVVTVENEGNSDAYVRTIVALEAGKTAEQANKLWYNSIALTTGCGSAAVEEDNDLYVKIGENYYIIVVYTYKEAIAAGAESVPSITGVALYAGTTQEDVADFGETYEVMVLSQAVQVADMGDDAGAALDKAFGDVNADNVAAWFAA